MGWQVIIAPSARADLKCIVRYIARHNSDAAARIGYELIVRAESGDVSRDWAGCP